MSTVTDIDKEIEAFENIRVSQEPSNVKTVSMLRHYVNCHGTQPALVAYFHTDKETLQSIRNNCPGGFNVKELINNPEEIEECRRNKESKEKAKQKNLELVAVLKEARIKFCGVGTREIKLILNRLKKTGNYIAEIYRIALEIEDENIKAKDDFIYADAHYNKKRELINDLIELCKKEHIPYGVQKSDIKNTTHIIFFDLPGCAQISFHTSFSSNTDLPEYKGKWDGMVNSTLKKLECAISNTFPEEISYIKHPELAPKKKKTKKAKDKEPRKRKEWLDDEIPADFFEVLPI